MENGPYGALDAFRRNKSVAKLDAAGLAKELLDCFRWDQQLREILFHSESDIPPDIQKRLNYHIGKNVKHNIEVRTELTRRGQAGIDELEKLYRMGDPYLIHWLGRVHIDLIPETAKQELTRLLASDTLEAKHRRSLSEMLGAVERRLAGEI